jgi:peptide/nickel transport system substrate-binding protein
MSERNYWQREGAGRVSRRRVLRGAAFGSAGLTAAALVGCSVSGGSSKNAAPSGASATARAGGSPAAAGAAKPGGRLARGSTIDPDTLDLHQSETSGTITPAAPFYNNLLQFDPLKVDDGPNNIIPDLAASYEVAPDGQSYTFKLVQNVKFHDGTPFTSADVKASIARQQNPPPSLSTAPRQLQLKIIDSIQMPDDYTVKMNLTRPEAPGSFLSIMAQGWMAMYSKKDIDANFDYKHKANGTGPFRNLNFIPSNIISMERNKDYWVKGRPYLDGMDLYNIPNAATADEQLIAGKLHIGGATPGTLGPIKAALGTKANYFVRPDLVFDMMSYNTTKAPWNDPRVRLALAHALNRDDGIKTIQKGAGRFGAYMRPGGPWALSDDALHQIPGYEPPGPNTIADAKQLLAAAGVKDGLTVPLLIRQAVSEPQGLWAADQLRNIGINITQDVQQSAVAYERLNKKDFDLVLFGLTTALDDQLKDSPGNYANFTTPELEAAFLKQSVEQDAAKRKDLVDALQKLSIPMLGKVVLYWKVSQAVAAASVQDWTLHARVGDYNNSRFQDVWMKS